MTPLLYIAPVAWHDLWQRPQRLALALAEAHDVTYFNPVGMRSARWSDWRRLFPQACVPAATSGVPLFRPRYLPWQSGPIDAINRRWLAAQARSAFPALSRGEVTLWIGAPSLLALTLLDAFHPANVVYDCMDHFAGFHTGRARRRIEAAEATILSRAQLVFVASRPLAEDLRTRHARVVVAPNGVDVAHFSSVKRRADQGNPAQIVVGFHGTLGEWLNYELIESLAIARPSWRWEFVGPIRARAARKIATLPNVHCLAATSFAELPERLARFDVGIIPFVRNRLTDAAHPLKLGEYLAAGIPVVATRLQSLTAIPGHVALAETPADWLAALEAAVQHSRSEQALIAERRVLAGKHSWRRTAEIVLAALGELHETSRQNVHDPQPQNYRSAA